MILSALSRWAYASHLSIWNILIAIFQYFAVGTQQRAYALDPRRAIANLMK